jgi:hypothetical protein
MHEIAFDTHRRIELGKASRELISGFSLTAFATGLRSACLKSIAIGPAKLTLANSFLLETLCRFR